MISGKQILWGTLGWAFGGPIGGILGVIFAGSNDQSAYKQVKQSQAGDFMVSLLVLFAKVMKADGKLLKSELDYVKNFLRRNLSRQQSQVFIKMFQEILKQEYRTAKLIPVIAIPSFDILAMLVFTPTIISNVEKFQQNLPLDGIINKIEEIGRAHV